MSFNLLGGDSRSADGEGLTNYIVNQNMDFVALQEVDMLNYGEDTKIISKLNQKSNQYKNTAISPHREDHGLMTISKYPIEGVETIQIYNGRRIQTGLINTGVGKYRFFNVHITDRGADLDNYTVCPAFTDTMRVIDTYTDYPKMIVGDFNIPFYRDNLNYEQICGGALANKYSTHTCPTQDSCEISHQKANSVVDYAFVQKDSPLTLNSGFIDQSILVSDHYPVNYSFTFRGADYVYPTPNVTPSPAISPTPSNKNFDVNGDTKVSILDVIELIKLIFR